MFLQSILDYRRIFVKTPYFVITMGLFLFVVAIMRFANNAVPGLVIAVFSIVAAFTSISDFFELMRNKSGYKISSFTSFGFFGLALYLWGFPPENISTSFAQLVGDGFTILGLSLVIGMIGFKEIPFFLAKNRKRKIEEISYDITEIEYNQMLEINDIIERLKEVDIEILQNNRVHNGWGLLYDVLSHQWNSWKGPFYDGLNRKMFLDFLIKLDHITEDIANIAGTDVRNLRNRQIEIWGEKFEVYTQSTSTLPYNHVPSLQGIINNLGSVLLEWESLKKEITSRYQRERAKQNKK